MKFTVFKWWESWVKPIIYLLILVSTVGLIAGYFYIKDDGGTISFTASIVYALVLFLVTIPINKIDNYVAEKLYERESFYLNFSRLRDVTNNTIKNVDRDDFESLKKNILAFQIFTGREANMVEDKLKGEKVHVYIKEKGFTYDLKMSKSNNDFFKEKKDWSLVKDRLLGCYLAPYFQKVLATGKPICYVDCFSGKGKFEDGNPGSPIIALQTRNKCLQQSRVSIDKRNAISMSFIDLNYACDLQQNLAEFDNTYGKLNIVGGKYEEKILDILKTQKGKNVFLYIDPYGIKALDTDLFKQFNSFGFNTFEMLINFNSFGFFRDACRVMSVDYKSDSALQNLEDLIEYDPSSVASEVDASNLLTRIAGGDYWKDIVRDYKDGKIDGYKAEQRLSTEYKLHLKKYYSYVLDMPIRLKSNSRPKYRMVHVSNHEDGCFLMGQNMQNRKDELYTNIQSGGQLSIFDLVSDLTQSVEGDWIKEEDIKEKIKTEIDNIGNNINITKFIARFINEYGLICDFNFINEELKTLEKTGEIEIVRNPAISEKTKKPLTFMTEDRNHTVIIRRKKA